jgi:hypothetical protein
MPTPAAGPIFRERVPDYFGRLGFPAPILFYPERTGILRRDTALTMSTHASSFPPPEFSWLSPAARPSAKEVETYAHIINAVENNPPERLDSSLHEAELQLWIWRNETRELASKRRPRARALRTEKFSPAAAV